MDVFILTEHRQNYYIIKHANEDCVHMIYFDPQKYPDCNKFKGEGLFSPMQRFGNRCYQSWLPDSKEWFLCWLNR